MEHRTEDTEMRDTNETNAAETIEDIEAKQMRIALWFVGGVVMLWSLLTCTAVALEIAADVLRDAGM